MHRNEVYTRTEVSLLRVSESEQLATSGDKVTQLSKSSWIDHRCCFIPSSRILRKHIDVFVTNGN